MIWKEDRFKNFRGVQTVDKAEKSRKGRSLDVALYRSAGKSSFEVFLRMRMRMRTIRTSRSLPQGPDFVSQARESNIFP